MDLIKADLCMEVGHVCFHFTVRLIQLIDLFVQLFYVFIIVKNWGDRKTMHM